MKVCFLITIPYTNLHVKVLYVYFALMWNYAIPNFSTWNRNFSTETKSYQQEIPNYLQFSERCKIYIF